MYVCCVGYSYAEDIEYRLTFRLKKNLFKRTPPNLENVVLRIPSTLVFRPSLSFRHREENKQYYFILSKNGIGPKS